MFLEISPEKINYKLACDGLGERDEALQEARRAHDWEDDQGFDWRCALSQIEQPQEVSVWSTRKASHWPK